jgi:Na+-translocating ferredoxin:NAD+ oxidoreductase RnfA subunit
MSSPTTRRTVRRGTATVCALLGLLLLRVEQSVGHGRTLAWAVAVAAVGGSVLYLLASGARQLSVAADTPF